MSLVFCSCQLQVVLLLYKHCCWVSDEYQCVHVDFEILFCLDGLFFYNQIIQSQRLPCSDLFIYCCWTEVLHDLQVFITHFCVFSPILRYRCRLAPFGFVTLPKSLMNIWCFSKWIPRLCYCWIVDSRDQGVNVLLIFYIRLFISPLCRNSSWLCYSPSILIFCVAKHWMSGG